MVDTNKNIWYLDKKEVSFYNVEGYCESEVEGNLVIHNAIDGREDFEMEEDNERVH